MNHKEFMTIATALGCPRRGWQSNAVKIVERMGMKISQASISQIVNNPEKNISDKIADVWRTLGLAISNGNVSGVVELPSVDDEFDDSFCSDPDESKSDDEIIDEISVRFSTMEEMVDIVLKGHSHGIIIGGPPGCGKSHVVREKIETSGRNVTSITGHVTPISMYKSFYNNPTGVHVFDDADSVFSDPAGMNLLKGALDVVPPGKPKWISWMSESRALRDEEGEAMDKTIDFQGQIIFLSNIDFHRQVEKGNSMSPHFSALIDRTGYLDLGLSTPRRQMLRIVQVARDGELFEINGISDSFAKTEILDFVKENLTKWNNLSMRLIANIAKYYKASKNWRALSETLMKKQ